jgi:secreted PhoX family phosphatase
MGRLAKEAVVEPEVEVGTEVGTEAEADRARGWSRRELLRSGLLLAGGAAIAGPLQALATRAASAAVVGPYGPLQPTLDRVTKLPLLKLPAGFQYVTMGWTGDPMNDGRPTPGGHDGMACFRGANGTLRLVRNHELVEFTGSRAPAAATYDPLAGGGTTTLEVDPLRGTLRRSFMSLSGTLMNCAGGPTPWRSWLTCEEFPTPEGFAGLRAHGFVFEVPALGMGDPAPIRGLGRMRHEAVCIDPATGAVYATEDEPAAGFYRYTPIQPGNLGAGGTLEMLVVDGSPAYDTRTGQTRGVELPVTWVTIDEPDPALTSPTVFQQGLAKGGATFARLEGVAYSQGSVFFSATSGGDAGDGQIWEYLPARARLRLAFESPADAVLSGPDNLTGSPRGGLVICEDGDGASRLHGLLPNGTIFPFAENHIVLDGEVNGLRGDFTGFEFAGACYDPYGKWLFFNCQTPGVTFGVTGPWGRGAL